MKKEIARFPHTELSNEITKEEDLFDESAGAQAISMQSMNASVNISDGGMLDNTASGEAYLAAQQAVRSK